MGRMSSPPLPIATVDQLFWMMSQHEYSQEALRLRLGLRVACLPQLKRKQGMKRPTQLIRPSVLRTKYKKFP